VIAGPAEGFEGKLKVHWSSSIYDSEPEAKESLEYYRKYGYKGEYKFSQNNDHEIQWDETWEVKDMISPEALRNYWTSPAPPTQDQIACIDTPTREMGASRPMRDHPLSRTHKGKLTTSWISQHPTKDLMVGSGTHEVLDDGLLINIHALDGHCMASLTKTRAMILWRWYWETNPLNGTSEQFAIVVATTCAHYSSNKLNLKNHWYTPPILVSEIIKAIGAATERFSSPLNAHPSIHKHYSYREADAIFGFKYDAYSARFSGPWYMNPEYDAEEIAKSVRWAASSAASDTEPNLGIAIIPKYDKSAHTAMLGSPGIHVLATTQKGFHFVPYTAWTGEGDRSTGTKFPVDIVVIYNSAGLKEYGSGLAANSEFTAYLEKEHRLQNTYTPPPSLPTGINGPVVGHESANHLLRRWPPHFRDVPHEQPCPIQHINHTHKTPSIQWKAPGQLTTLESTRCGLHGRFQARPWQSWRGRLLSCCIGLDTGSIPTSG
jgi:hypothetical protein